MKSIWLSLDNESYEFAMAKIKFNEGTYQNCFTAKNNKTVQETLLGLKYQKLALQVETLYPSYLDWKLGEFLLDRKNHNDGIYKSFLNTSGDLEYCRFALDEAAIAKQRGIYIFGTNAEVKYLGRCLDSFSKRINQGYGNISPKNCFIDGQVVNCRINNNILKFKATFEVYTLPLQTNSANITEIEQKLIAKYKPEWNIQLKNPRNTTGA